VLALVSVPGSIHYQVLPGLHRDQLLDGCEPLPSEGGQEWWRPITKAT
jgi:hypothetical protein